MKNNLISLLAESKTEQVLAELRNLHLTDGDLRQLIVQNAARFAALEQQEHAGTLSFDEANRERNKINAALMAVVEKLPKGGGQTKQSPTTATKSFWIKIGAAIVTTIGIFAGIAEISGCSLKEIFGKKDEPPAQEVQPPDLQSEKDTSHLMKPAAEETQPRLEIKPASKKTEPKNHFESHDQSKQINIPDNQGTININQ